MSRGVLGMGRRKKTRHRNIPERGDETGAAHRGLLGMRGKRFTKEKSKKKKHLVGGKIHQEIRSVKFDSD